MNSPRTTKSVNRIRYIVHKAERHNGKTDYKCSVCADFEYVLMQNKTRRDSE